MSNEKQTEKRRPTHKLVQEKTYMSKDMNGNFIRKTKNVTLAYGWTETSQKGVSYISFGTEVQSVTPDIDGRIKRVLFEINYDESRTKDTIG